MPITIQRPSDRLIMLPGLGIQVVAALADGVTYLLRDEFTTDAAAPLTSPRTCEPGPGTLTRTASYGSAKGSISGSKLTFVSDAASEGWYWSVTPAAGLAIRADYQFTSGTFGDFGICGNTTNLGVNRFSFLNDRANVRDNESVIVIPNNNAAATELVFVVGSSRHKYVHRISGSLVIAWISQNAMPGSPVGYIFSNTTQVCEYDDLSVVQLPAPWSSDYGIADVHATPAVSGTDYTGQANAIIDQAVTAPASLAGEAGYWFRKQDASNGYKAYFNSAGAFLVDRYVAGVPTNVVSVAGVITGSGTRTIRTIADGTSLRFYTLSGTTWTQRGGTITDSNFGSQTTITPFADGSWTGGGGSIGQLDSWPRTLSGAALAALNAV